MDNREMDVIDLTQFYDKNEFRSNIAAPFSDAEHTYATDGHIVIRVPRRLEVEQSPFAPKADRLFAERTGGGPRKWFDIPKLPAPVMEPCECVNDTRCDPCPDCNGTEVVEKIKSVDIGGMPFQRKLLAKLVLLPNCVISPAGPKPAWFRFDGGDGLLCPMKWQV